MLFTLHTIFSSVIQWSLLRAAGSYLIPMCDQSAVPRYCIIMCLIKVGNDISSFMLCVGQHAGFWEQVHSDGFEQFSDYFGHDLLQVHRW